MRKMMIEGMEYEPRLVLEIFNTDPTSKFAFISSNESTMIKRAENFIQAAKEKTGAHLLKIDVMQVAADGSNLMDAVHTGLRTLAKENGIALPDFLSRTLNINQLCKNLQVQRQGQTVPTPIIYFQHFQFCKWAQNDPADLVFLRDIPGRLVFSSNMIIEHIEWTFMPFGAMSILSPITKKITIEEDHPFECSQLTEACAQISAECTNMLINRRKG